MGVVRELLFLSKNKENHIQDELFEGCSKVVRRAPLWHPSWVLLGRVERPGHWPGGWGRPMTNFQQF